MKREGFIPPQGDKFGAIAQLGERLHGMQEVNGSIPFSSTNLPGFALADLHEGLRPLRLVA
jgi:hypothetical protein